MLDIQKRTEQMTAAELQYALALKLPVFVQKMWKHTPEGKVIDTDLEQLSLNALFDAVRELRADGWRKNGTVVQRIQR